MKKRVLSLLMAIAICLSMLPSAALAEIPGTGTNEGQTEEQIPDEQKPEEQIPEERIPDEQNPDEQNPDKQNPEEQNPEEQNPDEQKPAKAPRKVPAAETHTGDHGRYTMPEGATWQGVSSLPTESGYYYLTGYVKIDSTWKPADGTVLCLNGYGISMTKNGPVIEVQPGVIFTLCDCNGGKGKITHGENSDGKKPTGRGVHVSENGTFTMYGGSITGNTSPSSSGDGVYVSENGTFTMNGGSITGNKSYYGGVYVKENGTFTMNGGEITGNTSSSYGGGVYVSENGTFIMNGGSITDNAASSENKSYGGGVYSAGTFTMTGGSITRNKAKYGGGVWTGASFTVTGNVNITGNVGIDSKTASNGYLAGNSITIGNGKLEPEARIGVTSNKIDPGKFATIATGAKDSCTADNFTADAGEPFGIKVERGTGTDVNVNLYNGLPHIHYRCNGKDENGAETCNGIGHTEENVLKFTPWTDANELPTASGEYYLTTDVTLDSAWDLRGAGLNEVRFVLCLNGHSIKLKDGAAGNVINI